MIKTSKIIEVPISAETRTIAYAKSDEMGKLNNSILVGKGNEVGFIGEEVVKKYLTEQTSGEIESGNHYDYDFIFQGKKFEVKTKLTTVQPKSSYDCSVANFNPNQKCDYYIFARVHEFWEKGWLLGYMTPKEYYEQAVFMKKGDIDPSNNYTVKADCYNVKILNLRNIKDLIKSL